VFQDFCTNNLLTNVCSLLLSVRAIGKVSGEGGERGSGGVEKCRAFDFSKGFGF